MENNDIRYSSYDYEIKVKRLKEDEGGGWYAEIPLLPGCSADGESLEEAIINLQDAKDSWIKTCLELGRTVPEPEGDNYSGQLRIRMPKSLHKALSQKAKDENVSLNQLIVYHLSKSINQTF